VILWLGVLFVWFALTVLRGRRSLFAVGAVVAGFAATAALNVVDPDALIARTNLNRPRVDVAYVAGLSDDAVPALLEELPSLRPDLRRALATELLKRSGRADGWRSFNLARARAAKLLAEHRAELVAFAGYEGLAECRSSPGCARRSEAADAGRPRIEARYGGDPSF
jgi:hypothetical protein